MIHAASLNQNYSKNTPHGVQNAIHLASQKTGVDFSYLVRQAEVESGMNPTAKARTSSATGLYQFIEQTWLRMMKNYGHEHGYGQYASTINQRADGRLTVQNAEMRKEILNLRNDAKASSLMAAELAGENQAYLKSRTGKEPNSTDLYMAHFLGAGGAGNFINSLHKNPWAPAASLFPDAARANPNVFYKQGKPLSLKEVYARFEGKFESTNTPQIQMAKANSKARPNPVRIKAAERWDDPAITLATRSNNSTINSLRQMFAPDTSNKTDSYRPSTPIPGGFLQSPLTVMELASTHKSENSHNRRRYNA